MQTTSDDLLKLLHLMEAEFHRRVAPEDGTSTVSFCVVGSTSETTAAIVANGPSMTVT